MNIAKTYYRLLVFCATLATPFPGVGQNGPVAYWTFDEIRETEKVIPLERKGRPAPDIHRVYSVTENISGRQDRISGSWFKSVPGILGNALQLDGNTGFISVEGEDAPQISGEFSVQVWIAMASYPTNWCPLADQSTAEDRGYSLGVDAHGHPDFKIKTHEGWMSISSEEKLPLGKWNHLSCTYHKTRGIALYINGQMVGEALLSGEFEPSLTGELMIGKHSVKAMPEGTVRKHGTAKIYTFYDGLVDELMVYDRCLRPEEIKAYIDQFTPGIQSALVPRQLPSAADGVAKFGAYYTTLHYYEAWDALWRVGDFADVVVTFEQLDGNFVFWRGTSYIPHWVTENGIWYDNEFNETWSGTGCHEPMSDKRCEHSHVRILENSPARVVVHWRYVLVDNWLNKARQDSLTGWGDWTDEIYTIYPDGVAVRSVTLHSSQPQAPHEWQESIVVMGPGQRPEGVIEPGAITLVNMQAETHTYSWENGIPEEADGKGFVTLPGKANIQRVNTRSRWKPFLVVSPDSHPTWDIYRGEIRREYSMFPWWNHWPAAQKPSDGRFAMDSDQAAHSSLSHVYWDAYASEDGSMTKLMLNGLTDRPAEEIVPLARSWSSPAKLRTEQQDGIENLGYDPAERAYQLEVKNPVSEREITLSLDGCKEAPLVNPCIVIRNWGDMEPHFTINGAHIEQDERVKFGFRHAPAGMDLVLWISIQSEEELVLGIHD